MQLQKEIKPCDYRCAATLMYLCMFHLQKCTRTDQQESIPLHQLLDKIKRCGQKELANHHNPCHWFFFILFFFEKILVILIYLYLYIRRYLWDVYILLIYFYIVGIFINKIFMQMEWILLFPFKAVTMWFLQANNLLPTLRYTACKGLQIYHTVYTI